MSKENSFVLGMFFMSLVVVGLKGCSIMDHNHDCRKACYPQMYSVCDEHFVDCVMPDNKLEIHRVEGK